VNQPTGGGKAIASLVLGVSGLLAWCVPLLGFPICVVGIVLGAMSLRGPRGGFAIAGLVTSIVGLVLTLINGLLGGYMAATGQHPLFQ
jgi:uncharacterized membrane protein